MPSSTWFRIKMRSISESTSLVSLHGHSPAARLLRWLGAIPTRDSQCTLSVTETAPSCIHRCAMSTSRGFLRMASECLFLCQQGSSRHHSNKQERKKIEVG